MRTLAVTLATLALASAGSAAVGGVKTLSTELNGVISSTGGWCCGTSWSFEGGGVVPSVGTVTFAGVYEQGVLPGESLEVRTLQLTVVAANGDTFTIAGYVTWPAGDPAPALSWSLVDGSGRFARYSGSGTYALDIAGATVALTLQGVLTSR